MDDESTSHLSDDQDTELVRQLLSIKRHEKPDDAYFETFLTNFQTRQRSEMLSQSARSLLAERVGTWWWGLGGKKWVYGAGAATAAVAIGFAVRPASENGSGISPTAAENQSTAELRIDLPAGDSGKVPSLMSTKASKNNGFLPVSSGNLQEL